MPPATTSQNQIRNDELAEEEIVTSLPIFEEDSPLTQTEPATTKKPKVTVGSISPPPIMFCGSCASIGDGSGNNEVGTASSTTGTSSGPTMFMTLSAKPKTQKRKTAQMVFIHDYKEDEDDVNMDDLDIEMVNSHISQNNNSNGERKFDEEQGVMSTGVTATSSKLMIKSVLSNDYSTIVSTNVAFESINYKQRTLIQHVLDGMENLHSFQFLDSEDLVPDRTGDTPDRNDSVKSNTHFSSTFMTLATDEDKDERPMIESQKVCIKYNPNVVSIDKILESFHDLGVKNSILNSTTETPINLNSVSESSMSHDKESSHPQQPQHLFSKASSSSNLHKCRSSFYVDGICCASEVPIVTTIIKSIPKKRKYINKVSINITNRKVFVEYHPDHVTATEILDELKREGFRNSRIVSDGNVLLQKRRQKREEESKRQQVLQQQHDINAIDGKTHPPQESLSDVDLAPKRNTPSEAETITPKFVESVIYVPSMSEETTEIIHGIFESRGFLYNSIRSFSSNVASKTAKIEHNPKMISIHNIVDSLLEDEYVSVHLEGVNILVDGLHEGLILPDDNTCPSLLKTEGGRTDTPFGRAKQKSLRYFPICGFGSRGGLEISVVLSGVFWIISISGHFLNNDVLMYTGLLSVIFGLPPVAKKAFHTLRRKQFDANCLMVTAALGAIALHEFDEAASVSFLFAISESLEDRATRKARKAMDEIINLRPEHANYINQKTGEIKIVPVNDLYIGDLVSVRMGDKIPTDGIVVEGFSQLDESSLTGESLPLNKDVGDTVSGGTINVGSTRLVIRTTALVEDSAVSRLIKLVEDSATNRSQTEQLVDAFARSYTPAIVFVALILCTIPWFWGYDIGRQWAYNGLIIIVIACPCALTISTPVTYAAGLAATAQKGIIVKGGAKLEALGSVRKIIFDKTGTLTEGKFQLIDLQVVDSKQSRREVLELLAIMEGPSSHPLASALVKAAKDEGVQISNNVSIMDHSILKGEGVSAIVNGQEIYVGNARLFKRLGMYSKLSNSQKHTVSNWNDDGSTVGFIGTKSSGIVAMFCVADAVRGEAKEVVNAMINDNIELYMLTGDGTGPARSVANKVGIPQDRVKSQFLPEDKLHFIASQLNSSKQSSFFSTKDLLLMCGDGVNDAPALAIADIGVAMGEGAALALEISDVTLMDSNLTKLLFSIQTGVRVNFTVRENIAVSVAAKILVIILTFMGKMTLLGAITSDVGVMLLVSINGMKLLPGGPEGLCGKKRYKYGKIDLLEPTTSIV